MQLKKINFINSNGLKFIAAITMFIDHLGWIFFPKIKILRIIGRLAFPLFAFMIAEGCRYTRNKLRYLSSVAALALFCQTVLFLVLKSKEMGAPVTFTFSIIMVYALQNLKSSIFGRRGAVRIVSASALFIGSVGLSFIANRFLDIDYGFFGCMLPVFAALPHKPVCDGYPDGWDKLDCLPLCTATFAVGLAMLCFFSNPLQWWAMLSVPLLLVYSGRKGKLRTKYFFYVFYPAHLALLYGIAYLIIKLRT